jgi:hypothetical protein
MPQLDVAILFFVEFLIRAIVRPAAARTSFSLDMPACGSLAVNGESGDTLAVTPSAAARPGDKAAQPERRWCS